MWRNFLNVTLGSGTGDFTLPLWIQSARAYQTRTVQIVNGAYGVTEKAMGFDMTLVSCSLDVRNL